jgi:D-alanine-D-alanine ligase
VVWVLVPTVATDDPNLAHYSDYSVSRGEFERAFDALDMEWHWQPVSLDDHRAVIAGIAHQHTRRPVLIFNLCDGDETNGVPGLSVIRCLEEHGLAYTGADEPFYRDTTSKIDMKVLLDRAGVPTSPWEVVSTESLAPRGVFRRLGRPLIVKPAVSAGSLGIGVKSVVSSARALKKQLHRLEEGYRGWDLASAGVFVERFVDGPEFTSFIVGDAADPDGCTVYPAVERVFHASLPPTERFLSFDRLWEVYEEEPPIGDGEYLWEYRPAPAALQPLIDDVSWRAYVAVGGRGYGRVDLRMDAATGDLFVLEVNAQCGLSDDENQTSIGAILRFAERPYHIVVREILDGAVTAHRLVQERQSA